jgi:hypothetical protein
MVCHTECESGLLYYEYESDLPHYECESGLFATLGCESDVPH